jgi:hypothetical protein
MRFLVSVWVLLLPLMGNALTVLLDTEFDGPASGSFATMTVGEREGALDFSIALTPDSELGVGADLHEFYFNIASDLGVLSISSSDSHPIAYSLSVSPAVRGGAGASFDLGVNFGNGAGPPGNGVVQAATFTLSGLTPLFIADLFETSTAAGGAVTANFAAHFQGTSFGWGSDSETVGGVIPEPGTGLLFASGLGLLAIRGKARQ